jgi:hypothetical protein
MMLSLWRAHVYPDRMATQIFPKASLNSFTRRNVAEATRMFKRGKWRLTVAKKRRVGPVSLFKDIGKRVNYRGSGKTLKSVTHKYGRGTRTTAAWHSLGASWMLPAFRKSRKRRTR